jgi:hypothetical protein
MAHAEPFEWAGGVAWLHYEASALHEVDDTRTTPAPHDLALAGPRLHGLLGKRRSRLAYHIGLELAAGGTIDKGAFAYDVALFPVGVALRLGDTSFVALGAGVGAMGALGAISSGPTLPLQLDAEVGRGIRVLLRARVQYTEPESRRAGAPDAPFGDELDGMLGLRLGRHYDEYGFPTGNGYFIGAAYRELLGARYLGLTIGYSIDGGTPRRHADSDEAVRATREGGVVGVLTPRS